MEELVEVSVRQRAKFKRHAKNLEREMQDKVSMSYSASDLMLFIISLI